MQLTIKNRVVNTPIEQILTCLRDELNDGRFRTIKRKQDNVICTCPFHKDGKERKPSMNIYCGESPSIQYGVVHCFTCDYKATLPNFVADVLELETVDQGEKWLLDRFAGDFVEENLELPELALGESTHPQHILNPEILDRFNYKHPYMYQRGLTDRIIEYFHIGYDKERDAITFPVWDENDDLVAITERSVKTKQFYIPENLEKPVYLLNVVKALHLTRVAICESQLNTLNTWKYGLPAVGLFGTGSSHQLDLLKRSGIRHFILLFDGDEAGRKGATKFKKALGDNFLITDIHMYWGKDVSDLSAEEFYALLEKDNTELKQ